MVIHSDYLKGKENVFDGDMIKFLDAGVYGPSQNDPDKLQWLFWVQLPNGDRKKCTPNKTSCQVLKDAWGEMTEKWIDQDAKVRVAYENVFGEMRNTIYLEPAEGIAPPPTPITKTPAPPSVPHPTMTPTSPVAPPIPTVPPEYKEEYPPAFDPNTGEPIPN